MNLKLYIRAARAICTREFLRFLQQRGRFFAALVRPLVWLFVFATGFKSSLSIATTAPYQSAVSYDEYVIPGLIGMIQLFSGMQGSLSMVYDRELGAMRTLLIAPLPRTYLLICKLFAGVLITLFQVYAFLSIAWLYGIRLPTNGYITLFPTLMLTGLMLGAIGLCLSSFIVQLENFATVMNFVIFPMFFLSTALYPLGQLETSSTILHAIASVNPFSYAVELLRFSLYEAFNFEALWVNAGSLLVFLALAVWGYSPSIGMMQRKGGNT